MLLEYYSRTKLEGEIVAIVGKYLDPSKHCLFFFGSRVSGRGSDRSDIDIGIEGPSRISPAVMARIRADLEELSLLYTIDLVDFGGVSDEFRSVAGTHIEPFRTATA